MKTWYGVSALEAEYPFYTLGPTVGMTADTVRRTVWVRGQAVGFLAPSTPETKVLSVLEAEEGEG